MAPVDAIQVSGLISNQSAHDNKRFPNNLGIDSEAAHSNKVPQFVESDLSGDNHDNMQAPKE